MPCRQPNEPACTILYAKVTHTARRLSDETAGWPITNGCVVLNCTVHNPEWHTGQATMVTDTPIHAMPHVFVCKLHELHFATRSPIYKSGQRAASAPAPAPTSAT